MLKALNDFEKHDEKTGRKEFIMMGFENIVVWADGKKNVVSYKGQHYVLNGKRMSKAAICKKFEMHPAELARYIGGGFKKSEAYPNTNIVSIKRYLNDVQDSLVASSFIIVFLTFVIALMAIQATRNSDVLYFLFAGMFASVIPAILSDELEKLPTSITDVICGVKRARA